MANNFFEINQQQQKKNIWSRNPSKCCMTSFFIEIILLAQIYHNLLKNQIIGLFLEFLIIGLSNRIIPVKTDNPIG